MSLDKTGDRLKGAQKFCQQALHKKLNSAGIQAHSFELFLRAFKLEEKLEVWVRNKAEGSNWQLFISYPFCKSSGRLGPKRKEGDLQIPEGLYHIDRYNAKSKFYLSLGINYPNASDKILSDVKQPGSDIFIHGGCVTVGCIPITDKKIAELFVLATAAFENGQKEIPVHIFPTRMEVKQLEQIEKLHPQHLLFWRQLKVAYDRFEATQEIVKFTISKDGAYLY